MGRQVTAELVDLVLAGCTVVVEFEVLDGEVYRHAVVTFPSGKISSSYASEALVFDCRNRASQNFWALEELVDLGVPFTRS